MPDCWAGMPYGFDSTRPVRRLAGFFRSGALLVPVPGSRPSVFGAVSGPALLARALFTEGLGAGVWSGLRRVRAVPKSATATPGARPTAQIHYESLTVDAGSGALSDCVLIDDIVSKGRTLWAAAARMQEAFPGCRIGAFALLRTIGFGAGVDRLLSPCIGEISWRGGDVRRNP
ncbi:MAG: hypothetical protein M3O06_03020 [Pseudomonadota bacterium]|nr:hypothetical protein [Pseudomonadota bacterium]